MRSFFEFLNNLKKFGLEFFGRYYSAYPGVVVDNNDPDKRGRVKISLPSILGDGQIHHAWAEPAFVPIAGKSYGAFFLPYPGDVVQVMFENGDLKFPVFSGGSYANGELADSFYSSYGSVRGWVFKNGSRVVVDESSGAEKILIEDHVGTKILISDKKVLITADEVNVESGLVNVGSGASFSAVLGEKIAELFDKHTHMTSMGPSSPPTPPNTAAQANSSSGTAFLAGKVKLKGNE